MSAIWFWAAKDIARVLEFLTILAGVVAAIFIAAGVLTVRDWLDKTKKAPRP